MPSDFHPIITDWFAETFPAPTPVQTEAWPVIAAGGNALLLAPTGSGKTLASFLVAIDRIMFPRDLGRFARAEERAARANKQSKRKPTGLPGVHTVYISPLKALGVDIERNLQMPLAGIGAAARRQEGEFQLPTVGVRSGDTTASERQAINRQPPDILITTPESLYLLLTSKAREILRDVATVIIDEIHTLVASKRGSHLFLSLERLEELRNEGDDHLPPLQRIGLSATQRPLEEVARLLGGAESNANPDAAPRLRPVSIIEAGRSKQLELKIEVPVEDMTRLAQSQETLSQRNESSNSDPATPSIWPAIYPRLVELVREHTSTMIFVNSRRLAERLAAAINELAEEELALAHHGSIAKDSRATIEQRLKSGTLPAIVATSSLELGIDMGAVDLVIQIEAPPSIASGLQRIGRAGHQVGAPSTGVIFPKFRGDLLACSAAARRMTDGLVEETFYPRNPLDVLAQQLVAMCSLEPCTVDSLFATVRRAAPFHDLPRSALESVLDLLSGRYPSDEFAELRPRLTWDRLTGEVRPRKGAQRLAILNAGTIPDRGLYGVFLAGTDQQGQARSSRVGELDEEMVFETRPGDVFLLGASSWRVVEITNDRVLVVPAPGEPGRMPFWRGDGPGRPLEFGQAIGQLTRRLLELPREQAHRTLITDHALDQRAARNLLNYLHDQAAATGSAPSDQTIVVECFLDEVGDWRVAILSPLGNRVHAPWAIAVTARLREEIADEVDMMYTDDGLMFRLPQTDSPPPLELFFPASREIEQLVTRELGHTAMFAARFRENAARALLLPRQRPGRRTPLWLQRRRSADLLQVASRYPSFPMLLETYRECLRDAFDLGGLVSVLEQVERESIRVMQVETKTASPFASSLLFSYVGNFLYNGDAPLAERRAATLALDQAQLRELLGDAQLRQLLDAESIDGLARELQRLDHRYEVAHADNLHDMLLALGDLTREEIDQRAGESAGSMLSDWIYLLVERRRILSIEVTGQSRYIAVEDASRFRDALDCRLPPGLPAALLEPVAHPVDDLVSRFARTHIPFRPDAVAHRFGLPHPRVRESLTRLAAADRVLEGEFLPGGRGREWVDSGVLRTLKRRSLAKLREQVKPVEPAALARFLPHWQGIERPRKGLEGLLDTIEQLQGVPLPASDLEQEILPARVVEYMPGDLDQLCTAGEVVWRGFESLGSDDGRIALYLTEHAPFLAPPAAPVESEQAEQIRRLLAERGALFFDQIVREVGGFRPDCLSLLWEMVWSGEVTGDTLTPLRSLRTASAKRGTRSSREGRRFRSRRTAKTPGSEGRWTLLHHPTETLPSLTQRLTAMATSLLERYGVVTREMVSTEGMAGGFSALYPVLKAMEESGRTRRGYFVAGLGAAQFAVPGADDRLRRRTPAKSASAHETIVLAACDPANPYGGAVAWPQRESQQGARPARAAGAMVIVSQGELIGYLSRTGQSLTTFLPGDDPQRSASAERLIATLAKRASETRAVFIGKIDGQPASESALAEQFQAAGFVATSKGMMHRRTVG